MSDLQIVLPEKFMEITGNDIAVGMDLSLFYGSTYECACGDKRAMGWQTKLLCQGYWTVVAVCPDDEDRITLVKVRIFLYVKFLGFQCICGCILDSDEDKVVWMSMPQILLGVKRLRS